MRLYFAPGFVFVAGVVSNLILVAGVVYIATSQPWLGVQLSLIDGNATVSKISEHSTLPSQFLDARLVGLGGVQEPPVVIVANDLIEEPDMIGDSDQLRTFYAQQRRLFAALANDQVSLILSSEGTQHIVTVDVRDRRPIASLPLKFWMQLGVGFVGLFIGFWVICLRPRDLAAWMILITGLGLALSAGAAALYSSREIALGYNLFTMASRINGSGTLMFGIGILTLFLFYPRAIVPKFALALPALSIGSLIVFIQVVDWPRYVRLVQDGVAVIMFALLIAIAIQVIVNRRDPAARAMLGWLGLSVVLGAGGFVLTAIVPTLLGQELLLAQSTAFLFFLLIYAGIALGVARYRLFDLSAWSFGILFYGFGVTLLLLLDASLIYGLSVERAPAFGIALAVIGGIYLPLRRRVAQWISQEKRMPAEELYRRVTEISHALDPGQKQVALRLLWEDIFSPLSIYSPMSAASTDTALEENGAVLTIAPVRGMPALHLRWANRGRRLFSKRDMARAKSINAFIDTSLRQSQTYAEAVDTERTRINRDMHDNIGVLLVGALHAESSERKDALIRQTLADLREIISNPDQSHRPLPQLVADLRAEISSHLDAADIAVEWHYDGLPEIMVEPLVVHTLRSLIRESTNNIVRHSGASKVSIGIDIQNSGISVSLHDNGHGFDQSVVHQGNGFKNLLGRVAQLDGTFGVKSAASGTKISAVIPLGWGMERAAE